MRWIALFLLAAIGGLQVALPAEAEEVRTTFTCPEDTSPKDNYEPGRVWAYCYNITSLEIEHYLSLRAGEVQERLNSISVEEAELRIRQSRFRLWLENRLHNERLKLRRRGLSPTSDEEICRKIFEELRNGDPCVLLLGPDDVGHTVVAFAAHSFTQGATTRWTFNIADSNPASWEEHESGKRGPHELTYDNESGKWAYSFPSDMWQDRHINVAYVSLSDFRGYTPPPGTGSGGGGAGADYAETKMWPYDPILVIDRSGSIQDARGVMYQIEQDAEAFVDELMARARRVAIVNFSGPGDIHIDTGFTAHRGQVLRAIQSPSVRGGATALFQAVDEALRTSPGGGKAAIILFTDGGENRSHRDINLQLVIERAQDRGVPVLTVGYTGTHGRHEAELKHLADSTGAFYERAEDLSVTTMLERFSYYLQSKQDARPVGSAF